MLKSGRETTNEKLNASINLTNSVAALCYEHLSTTLRIPAGFQSLVDDIGGFLRILRAVNLRKIGASEFGLAICECVKHMTWLRRRLGGKRMKRWKSSDVAEYRRRIERLRMLWETAAAEMDQLPTPKVIDAHISGTIFEKGPLLYDYDYELEVLARGKREKVLNWLYPEPYDKRHLEIKSRRNDNIGKWFFTSHEAQKWIKNKHAVSLLWGRSYAGSGKTFLSSLIIDTIKDHTPQGSVGVAYIYFNYKDQAQQRPAQVFASMIRQFSDQLPKLPVEVADLYGKLDSENRRPTATQLFTLLITVVESFDYAYVIWDAFDECDRVLQRKQLIPLFQRMAQSGSFRLFVTSRIGILAEDKGQDIFSAFGLAIKIHISARDEDIRTYIEEKIKENPRFQRLIRIGNYGERIVSELQICSRKLFLQVDLHIEYLCQQPTLRKVLIELEKLNPYTDNRNDVLAQSLNLALNTLLNQTKTLVKLTIKTLSWLVKAQRTFTIRELKQAISVEPGHYKLDESAIPDDETLIDVCAGLVVIDGDTVRLSHKSVHEYLVENALIPQNAEEDIAMACITFLSYHDFSRGACGHTLPLEIRRKMYPFMDYAAKNLGFHLQSCDENITIDPLSYFIEHQGRLASYLQALKAHNSYSKDSGYNIRYIKRTPLHVAASLGHSSLVRLLLERGATDLDTKSTSYSIGDRSAIHCATNAGHASIVRMLLQRGTNVSEAIDGEKALLTAACGGWGSTVKLLLEEGADISDVGYDGDTALHRAASNGHLEVARILLDKGLSLSVKARDGMTALHRAASLGHDSVVELLLDRGANISSTGDNRETALHQAAYGGHRGVVEMLLRGGANISATKTYGETPLHCAASGGHEQVVQLLLDRGADVGASAVKNGGETALHQAASEGFKMVVRALIDSGADIEVKTRYGVSVLQRAAHGGHTSVVRFLLDKGADVSAATKYGVTALHRAASAGHEATVQLLLERGAIHSAFDSDGETALHGAAAGGHYYVVKLLMEHGAKIDELTKNTGETALHKAAFGGHRLLVDFLLQVGANRLASAKDGSIPLHRAASCGHGSVARALLKDLAEHQVSAAKHNGETPIHCATFGGYDSMVTLLIESGAEVSKRNYRGETALHVAAYGGHISTAFILLDHGARVTDKTDYSENTIDRARAAGHTKLRDLLQNELS